MSRRIIALVGISGVGKSTVLREISQTTQFQHLQASAVIGHQRELEKREPVPADLLRFDSIDENQRLLISGFRNALDASSDRVVLDGHTVIDTPDGLLEIPATVFAQIGVTHFVFLSAKPEEILQHRESDRSRNRPLRDAGTLRAHQDAALQAAAKCAAALNIPLTLITADATEELERILRGWI